MLKQLIKALAFSFIFITEIWHILCTCILINTLGCVNNIKYDMKQPGSWSGQPPTARRLLCCTLHALSLRVHSRRNRRTTGCACCSPVQFTHKFQRSTAFGQCVTKCYKLDFSSGFFFTKWRGHISTASSVFKWQFYASRTLLDANSRRETLGVFLIITRARGK